MKITLYVNGNSLLQFKRYFHIPYWDQILLYTNIYIYKLKFKTDIRGLMWLKWSFNKYYFIGIEWFSFLHQIHIRGHDEGILCPRWEGGWVLFPEGSTLVSPALLVPNIALTCSIFKCIQRFYNHALSFIGTDWSGLLHWLHRGAHDWGLLCPRGAFPGGDHPCHPSPPGLDSGSSRLHFHLCLPEGNTASGEKGQSYV